MNQTYTPSKFEVQCSKLGRGVERGLLKDIVFNCRLSQRRQLLSWSMLTSKEWIGICAGGVQPFEIFQVSNACAARVVDLKCTKTLS